MLGIFRDYGKAIALARDGLHMHKTRNMIAFEQVNTGLRVHSFLGSLTGVRGAISLRNPV